MACRTILPALSLALAASLASCPEVRAQGLRTTACTQDVAIERMRCGFVRVPENYDRPKERQIDLYVVVLDPLDGSAPRSAQYDLDGGPGLDATAFLQFYAREGAAYRTHRAIVLADMRGAGKSNALYCSSIEEHQRNLPYDALYPPTLVRDCRSQLEQRADLRSYSTANAARDIDAVRRALGYEQLDVFALSYGTTLAMRYMAEFPQVVRSAVLLGTAPASRTPPRFHAQAAERGLTQLFAACRDNAACSTRFGDLDRDLNLTLQQLNKTTGPISAEVFMERLRGLMYAPVSARGVPLIVHRAARGDLEPFLQATRSAAARRFADGLYLSITCSETFNVIDANTAITASAPTRFGAYRLRRQEAACREWPKAKADELLFATPSFKGPVLLISGALDPATPPEWADEVANALPNSRHLVIKDSAHIVDGLTALDTCFDPLVLGFFNQPAPKHINAACLQEMRAPAWRLE